VGLLEPGFVRLKADALQAALRPDLKCTKPSKSFPAETPLSSLIYSDDLERTVPFLWENAQSARGQPVLNTLKTRTPGL
jgi:hypothetical protein